MHDHILIQSSKPSFKSQKTPSGSGSTANMTSSSPPDQSNNATLNQILCCLTNIKQDIKSLKHDVHNLE